MRGNAVGAAAPSRTKVDGDPEITEPRVTTLFELVRTLGEVTDSDREVVATVVDLLRSGRVRLRGNIRGCAPDEFSEPHIAPATALGAGAHRTWRVPEEIGG